MIAKQYVKKGEEIHKKKQHGHRGSRMSDLTDVVGGAGGVNNLLQNVTVSSSALQGGQGGVRTIVDKGLGRVVRETY